MCLCWENYKKNLYDLCKTFLHFLIKLTFASLPLSPLAHLKNLQCFFVFSYFVYLYISFMFKYIAMHCLRDNSSNHIFFSLHAQTIAFIYVENICGIYAEYIKRITLFRSKKEVAMKTGTSLSVVFLFVPKYTDNKCIRQTSANPPPRFSITFSKQRTS